MCTFCYLFFIQLQSATVYCICMISFFFFFFFFCQHFIDLYLRHDLTDFDQTWSQVGLPVDHPIYSYDQIGVKGHIGVTGVKNVKNSKMLPLLQITGYGHVTHVYMHMLDPLYKSYYFKNSPAVIWGHSGPKCHFP